MTHKTLAGGIANAKDVSPGTYNASRGTVPATSDPVQTKNTRDGQPLPSSARGSGMSTSGVKR